MTNSSYHHGDLKNALIQAGVEILEKEGVTGLTLRKVAKYAGVSHAAPYAHFADKQALIAAISTEGFKQLNLKIESIRHQYESDPKRWLIETAWTYIQFALKEPDRFKLMFSSVLEKEQDYPDFVEISKKNFGQLVSVVEGCQEVGVLKPGDPELSAVSIWGNVHGLVMLVLEGQISHSVLEKHELRDILCYTLNQMSLVPLP